MEAFNGSKPEGSLPRAPNMPLPRRMRPQVIRSDASPFCAAPPQVGKGMNRDYWARFERFVQLLANTCENVWIITGPLYLPRPTKEGWRMDYGLLGELVLAPAPARPPLPLLACSLRLVPCLCANCSVCTCCSRGRLSQCRPAMPMKCSRWEQGRACYVQLHHRHASARLQARRPS